MFRSTLQPMWDLTTHPLWGPMSSILAHYLSSSVLQFQTLIRNVSFHSSTDVGSHNSPPLGSNVVRFGPLLIVVSLIVPNRPITYHRESYSSKQAHLLIIVSLTVPNRPITYHRHSYSSKHLQECFVPLSNQCGISQLTPFGAQCHPFWPITYRRQSYILKHL